MLCSHTGLKHLEADWKGMAIYSSRIYSKHCLLVVEAALWQQTKWIRHEKLYYSYGFTKTDIKSLTKIIDSRYITVYEKKNS